MCLLRYNFYLALYSHLLQWKKSSGRRVSCIVEALSLLCSFLGSNVEYCDYNAEYLKASETVMNMKVTNYLAERGVKLMEEYNKILTNYEQQSFVSNYVTEINLHDAATC